MKLSASYNLEVQFPDLAREWHLTKNHKGPQDFAPHSGKYVWWICPKCEQEWGAKISDRTGGTKAGCPFCSGRRVYIGNCLATICPEIAQEWHPTLNSGLTPYGVTKACRNKVWWICSKGHEYDAYIYNRTLQQNGCPYCSGHKVCKDNCLATTHSEIAKEWHPTKNGELTPWDVTRGCDKRVWWVCSKGHEYDAYVYIRTGSTGGNCPFCAGQKVCKDNCLATLFPEIADQWHPFKNGELTPWDVTRGCDKRVWWICKSGHEWEAFIYERTNGTGCKKCAILNNSGSHNYNWKGGISKEGYPVEFRTNKLIYRILHRDNFTCQLCSMTNDESKLKWGRRLALNHINYNKLDCSDENLITLCISCNSKINYDRNYWTGYFQELLLNRTLKSLLAA